MSLLDDGFLCLSDQDILLNNQTESRRSTRMNTRSDHHHYQQGSSFVSRVLTRAASSSTLSTPSTTQPIHLPHHNHHHHHHHPYSPTFKRYDSAVSLDASGGSPYSRRYPSRQLERRVPSAVSATVPGWRSQGQASAHSSTVAVVPPYQDNTSSSSQDCPVPVPAVPVRHPSLSSSFSDEQNDDEWEGGSPTLNPNKRERMNASSDDEKPVKASSSTKKIRKPNESGETKEPKYVLIGEAVTIRGKRYCRAYRRPPVSYADLITYAIAQSPEQKLKLNSIYCFLTATFGYFKHHTGRRGWENSIRHNLSMKSKDRFLKIKASDHTEKGAYWHLNRTEPFYTDSVENAFETAEKLENWSGIVYYLLSPGEEPVSEPRLFSEEDKKFSGNLYLIENDQVTKFSSQSCDNVNKKKSIAGQSGRQLSFPLPPPPLHNLIKVDETEVVPAAAPRKDAPKIAPKPAQLKIKLKRTPSLTVDTRADISELRISTDGGIFGGMVSAWSEDELAGLSRTRSLLSVNHCLNTPISLFGDEMGSDDHMSDEEMDDTSSECSSDDYQPHGKSSPKQLPSPQEILFNDHADLPRSASNDSLLFGSMDHDMVPVGIDISALDLARLIADPSVPVDLPTSSWNGFPSSWPIAG